MEFTVTIEQLIFICGAIGTIAGAWKIVSKPYTDLKTKSETHDTILAKDKAHFEQIDKSIELLNKRLEEAEKSDNATLKILLSLLNHSIDGNGIDKMKQVRDEVEKELLK